MTRCSSIRPRSKNTGSKVSRAFKISLPSSTLPESSFPRALSARASSSICSIRLRICLDTAAILFSDVLRTDSLHSLLWASSVFVMITVSGVFSSCEASATNCRCCIHAVSTGLTAHRESRMLMPRNTRKLSAPMKPQVPSRAFSVARSLEISANTRQWFSGISER